MERTPIRPGRVTLLFGLMSLLWIPALADASMVEHGVATLTPVMPETCTSDCYDADAVVFVHGIFGSDETFHNKQHSFDWPTELKKSLAGEKVDIFRLSYRTALLSWAQGSTTTFTALSNAVYNALEPLREKKYRSIGFIAHSLGGNVITAYIIRAKSNGREEAFRHAYTIMIGTPVLGSDWANLGRVLKLRLRMNPGLLSSLETDNRTFLEFLSELREDVDFEGSENGCRATHLHAAFEDTKWWEEIVQLFDRVEAAENVTAAVDSPIHFFLTETIARLLNHLANPMTSIVGYLE